MDITAVRRKGKKMSKTHKQMVKDVRVLIGDEYWSNSDRGAKTNELGMTKSQVMSLAEEIVDYFERQE